LEPDDKTLKEKVCFDVVQAATGTATAAALVVVMNGEE
jgi:hypothetical protein